MTLPLTIADAAEIALKEIGCPASLEVIYEYILEKNLYQFNSPTAEHVLYTTLQRHLGGGTRIDARDEVRFRLDGGKMYSLTKTVETVQPPKSRSQRRIMRSAEKENFIQEVMSDRVGVFKEIWRLLLFAAQVGVKRDRRVPLQSVEPGKGIDQATFGNSASWPGILYLMNLTNEGGSEILSSHNESDERRVVVFQEFANGGLTIMEEFFKTRTVDLEGLLAFIELNQTEDDGGIGAANLDLTI
jgi:dnd system-associated protein 4